MAEEIGVEAAGRRAGLRAELRVGGRPGHRAGAAEQRGFSAGQPADGFSRAGPE